MSDKKARQIFKTIFAFPPNRATLGGTAYLILDADSQHQPNNILIDCPPWHEPIIHFLEAQGGVKWFVVTHRTGAGEARRFQQHFQCSIVVQEQEAYLLPQCEVTTFHKTFSVTPLTLLTWTPGYSPGTACAYHDRYGGVLFSGRHLLPAKTGEPRPLRFSKTFHWPRQLAQVERLRTSLSAAEIEYICPGANTGFLKGNYAIANAHQYLQALDLEALRYQPPLL